MKSSGSDSDIGDYLSNLQKKTAGNKFKIHIDGLSDLSLSDLSDKKENNAPVKSKFLKTTKSSKKSPTENFSTKKKSKNKKKEKKLKKKINDEKPAIKPVAIEANDDFSDLDMDFSFSSNTQPTKPSKPASNFVPKLQLNLSSRKSIDKIDKSDDNDESSFGKDGRRFLKPKNTVEVKTETVVKENKVTTPEDISSSRDVSSSPLKSTLRSSRSNSNKKKVTILEIKHDAISSLDTDIQNSFEEIMKNKSDSGSDTEKNFYGANIMSFDDLIEDDLDKESNDDIPLKSGIFKMSEKIMSIEELEDDYNNIKTEFSAHRSARDSQETNDSLSEIKTVPSVTPRKSLHQTVNQSISEIISVSQKESSEINSISSKIYSTDFDDSKKESIKQSTLKTNKSSRKSPTYSSDFTDEDPTIYSMPKGRSKKEVPNKPSTSANCKLSNLPKIHNIPIPPSAEMENVEPVPIAHYIVSPEALESITAYSPAMLLMTNMFRQQIQMTSSFIETQRRLYESLLSSIRPAYQYSSLEETKEFIKLNKTKPLTMKEALRLVENEEN